MATENGKPIPLMARFLGGIVGFGARRPRLALWMMVFLGCAAVGITVSDLKLKTSRSDLLTPKDAWSEYREVFGGESDFVVVVRTDVANSGLIQSVLDDLGQRLEREPEHFSNVLYKIDQSDLRRKALQYLSERDLQAAISRIDRFGPDLRSSNWENLSLSRQAAELEQRIRRATARQTSDESAIADAGVLAESLNQFVQVREGEIRINRQGFLSPWPDIVSTEIEQTAQDADLAYLMSGQRNVGMLHVLPVADPTGIDPHANSVNRLREHLSEIEDEYRKVSPDLKVALTGIPVLEHDELRRSGHDMLNAALIAFVAVGLLLSFGLRGMRHPMLVLIMLVNALAITFGAATLAVGHLNILSICFAAIVIGLGVDFGIHFVTRYLFLRQELYEMEESLTLAGQSVGTGIFTSALTTALAFGSAALTGYPGLAELGIVSASGILICCLLTFTFLPALIAISDEHVEVDELPVPVSGAFWRSAVTGFPLTAICLTVIGIGFVAWKSVDYQNGEFSFRVKYDSNLLNLQDGNLDSVQAERALAASDTSLLYAVALAESRDEVDTISTKLRALPTVKGVTELSSRIPPEPTAQQKQLISNIQTRLQQLPTKLPSLTAVNHHAVGRSLDNLYKALTASPSLQARETADELDAFLNQLTTMDGKTASSVLGAYDKLMASALVKEFYQVARGTSLEPVSIDNLPTAWRDRYLKVEGDRQLWLMKIYPKEDVWNQAALGAFVREIRSVAPEVTGVPVHNFDSAVRMSESYHVIAIYSLAAIAMFLLFDFLRPGQKLLTIIPPLLVVGFIGYSSVQKHGTFNLHSLVAIYLGMVAFIATVFDFRNLRDTFIALIPPFAGGVMLLGLMAALNVDFNPINLIVLPLVLGIGVDDGVHMVHDYRRQLVNGNKEYTPSGDTINGVMLTSLTSIIGFGSLMVSAHNGLKSVGIVLSLGVACCLAVSLILVPALLVLVAKYQPASMEPIPIKLPVRKAKSEDEGAESTDSSAQQDAGKKLSRKERRRQQAA